jgi:VWFA-related protein
MQDARQPPLPPNRFTDTSEGRLLMYRFVPRRIRSLKISISVAAILAVALFVPCSYGQAASAAATPAPAPAPQSTVPATILSSVDEVNIDMVVRNKKNKPVLDLTPGDIAVTDGGTAVKVSDLRIVSGTGDHMVTMVFDRLEPSAAKNARDIAGKILKSMPATGFSFSVLGIDGRLRLFHEFTSDREAVTKAIAAACERGEIIEEQLIRRESDKSDAAAEPEKNLVAVAQTGVNLAGTRVSAEERHIAQVLLSGLEDSQKITQDQHAQPALAALLALSRTQHQISGRKVVIYFAQGLRTDSNSGDMLRSIVHAANRSGVSIYAVDANALSPEADQGLVAMMAIGGMKSAGAQAGSSAAVSGSGTALTPTPQLPAGLQTQITDTVAKLESGNPSDSGGPLSQLAISTGGAYIGASDKLKKPLRQLVEDMTNYYEASYAAPIQEYDGRFRPVVVTPVRKGLKIKSRLGYFALPPSSTSVGIQPFEAPLMKILSDPQLPNDLKFRSAILKLGDLPDGNANALMVEVPISELELHQDANAGLFALRLAIVAQIKDKKGTVIEHFAEDLPRHGALDGIEAARSEVVTLQRHFIAAPGAYSMEVAVTDRNSGKSAAQRMDFEIAGIPAGPALSDVALVRRTDPMSAETDLLEPMRYENGRVVPSLSGQIPRDAKSIPLFFIVHPDPKSTEQPRLEMQVSRNGEPVGSVPLQLRKSSGHGAIPYLASIQAKSLAAGNYEAVASLTQDGKTVERTISFHVDGPELASASAGTMTGTGAAAGTESLPDASLSSGIESREKHALVITSLPETAVQPLDNQAVEALVADARQRAIGYAHSLPNFMCVEVTDRSIDPAGNGKWRRKDSMAELLRYLNNAETRTTLEMNGKASTITRAAMEDTHGTLSQGEFGGVLKSIFQDSSKADFKWQEAAAIGSETVQVLSYHITHENSTWALQGDNNWKEYPAFHGLVYIDAATKGVRRLTMVADNLPERFSIHSALMTVDYDYIAIGTHDYLMPIRASVSLTKGKREAVLNDMEFRNYRRYGSATKILYSGQLVK